MLRLDQLLSRPIKVEMTPIKMNRSRKMRFAGIGLKTNGVFDAGFGQLQTIFRVVVVKEIDQIVGAGELTMSQEKRRVARDGLVKELHHFKKILSLA